MDACGSVDAGVGEPQVTDPYLVIYVGVGTRRDGTVLGPRAMNVRLRYEALDDGVGGGGPPTTAPTMTIADSMKVATSIFPSASDAYVDSARPNAMYGTSPRLLVDGGDTSRKVSLIQLDLGVLNGQTRDGPELTPHERNVLRLTCG